MGHIGRFTSVDSQRYPAAAQVVCRTARGLEVAEVLSHEVMPNTSAVDGQLLRAFTTEDLLLKTRLDRYRSRAFRACERLMEDRGIETPLLDIELLFDGKSIYFYFLGEVNDELQALTDELSATYEAKAKIGQFADLLSQGCGPSCGTEEGSGCQTGGCSGCSVAAGCKTRTSS